MNFDLCSEAALVTGGTDGIGKEVARGLARAGLHVLVVGRDPDKGARAVKDIIHTTGNAAIQFLPADLSLTSEVNRLADVVAAHCPALHYLVHSAGIVRGRREVTAEGIESNFAVNYVSRFALTIRLLPQLRRAGRMGTAARIVIVGGAAQNGTIHFEDVNLTANFSTLRAVSQFCQANDMFTVEMASRLQTNENIPGVTITCLKIGAVKTNIRREFPLWMKLLVPLLIDPLLAQAREEVAETVLSLLRSPEFEGVTGALFLKIRKFRKIETNSRALGPDNRKRLWELSERLIGVAPSLAMADVGIPLYEGKRT